MRNNPFNILSHQIPELLREVSTRAVSPCAVFTPVVIQRHKILNSPE
jgi:hypothetical protein